MRTILLRVNEMYVSLDGFAFCVDLQDAQRDTRHHFAIAANIHGINAGMGEAQTLEIENQVAGQERDIVRQCDVKFRFDGHVVRIKSVTVLVDDGDGKLVATRILWSEAEAECQGAVGVNHRHGAGGKGVEYARHHQFTLVVGSEVAEGGNLNVHSRW